MNTRVIELSLTVSVCSSPLKNLFCCGVDPLEGALTFYDEVTCGFGSRKAKAHHHISVHLGSKTG